LKANYHASLSITITFIHFLDFDPRNFKPANAAYYQNEDICDSFNAGCACENAKIKDPTRQDVNWKPAQGIQTPHILQLIARSQ